MTIASLADLRGKVIAGEPFDAAGAEISAETIHQLVLALPLGTHGVCPLTAAGLVIRNATITERVALDRVMLHEGAPAPPIEFHECLLAKGFSGAHGKFSRLSFSGCTFGDPDPPAKGARPTPTIDLTDADIDSDLDMEGVKPAEPVPDEDGRAGKAPYLWIRAVGARIKGKVELSGCKLRAPPEVDPYPVGQEPVVALNLTLSTINGDIRILRAARLDGGIKLRGIHVGGDIWLRGATVTAATGDALVLQGAQIGGFLMMDGGWDESDENGTFHGFRCEGVINLHSAEVGRSLHLMDAEVTGEIRGLDLSVGGDFALGGSIGGNVLLRGCRIGGSLEVPTLNLAPSVTGFTLRHGTIARSFKLVPGQLNYRLLRARRADLRSLPGIELVEGLWQHKARTHGPAGEKVSEDYHLAQSAFFRCGEKLWALDGRGTIFDRVVRYAGHRIDETSVEEYLRLYCAWCFQENGLARIEEVIEVKESKGQRSRIWTLKVRLIERGVRRTCTFELDAGEEVKIRRLDSEPVLVPEPAVTGSEAVPGDPAAAAAGAKASEGPARFAGGLLLLPKLPKKKMTARILAQEWFVPPTLPDMTGINRGGKLEDLHARLRPHLQHRVLFAGAVDLENLTCGVLDDHAGRAWGGDACLINMDHFLYGRASWITGRDELSMSTYRRFSAWLFRNLVDWIWPRWMHWPEAWKRRALHWEPWQSRRNWIYHQFPNAFEEAYVSRYPIKESDYRPQPFEQAARVARAEGRESFAINFEMLKKRIEWRLFNLRSRWWLGVTGFALAYLWAALHGGNFAWVAFAFFVTIVLMLFLSPIHTALHSRLKPQWLHHTAMLGLFVIPAIVLYLLDGWAGRPLHFLIAVLIFLAIRSLSWLADFTLRTGFGYLRRPLRALVTLTGAFLIGWWGVAAARHYEMLVVDAEPVAGAVIPGQTLMGSVPDAAAARDIVCNETLVAPLYALDVLIPLVDLREESRCEIRHLPRGWEEATRNERAAAVAAAAHPDDPAYEAAARRAARQAREDIHKLEAPTAASITSIGALFEKLPALTIHNHHFWQVLKVLYAIAGWFIVSLALLTFTQVNRTREEALPEAGRR